MSMFLSPGMIYTTESHIPQGQELSPWNYRTNQGGFINTHFNLSR